MRRFLVVDVMIFLAFSGVIQMQPGVIQVHTGKVHTGVN